jgi:MFS family permease
VLGVSIMVTASLVAGLFGQVYVGVLATALGWRWATGSGALFYLSAAALMAGQRAAEGGRVWPHTLRRCVASAPLVYDPCRQVTSGGWS